MPIKHYKPITPTQRYKTTSTFEEITKTTPEKSLTVTLKKTGGRNNKGRITVRHRGGGHKRKYRIIDFKRNKFGIPAKVAAIEYDPNRSARIALLFYADGEKRYMICPVGLKVGDVVQSGPDAPLKNGNCLPLMNIPTGAMVHNIEMTLGKGGQAVRSAGTAAQVMAKEGDYVLIKMPSSEIRMVRKECIATLGQVGNRDHEAITIGKAGRNRWLGKRPTVRGVAMNPVDHPMGGGEGKSSGGGHPVSPWGKPAKGGKTRKKKSSDKLIVKKRSKK